MAPMLLSPTRRELLAAPLAAGALGLLPATVRGTAEDHAAARLN